MRELTRDEARELTRQIKGNVAGVLDLIAAAFDGRADVALGYPTWARYCHAEFPAIRYQSRDQRAAAVARLRERMSGRAISSALNLDEKTVRGDLRRGGYRTQLRENPAAEPRGLDGRRLGQRGVGAQCTPIEVNARITTALIHYARQAAALTADLAAQDYPPGWLTPDEQRAIIRFRAAQEDFTRTIEREEAHREDTA